MPSTKTKFAKCGHRGYGAHCHRCEQADKLEQKPPKGTPPENIKAEVERLRAPRTRKYAPAPVLPE